METKLVIRKVKPGKLQKLLSWFQALETIHKKEALETLQEEGVVHEFAYIVEPKAGEYYCIFYMRATSKIKPVNMDRELNQKHRAILFECLEKGTEGVKGYDLLLP